MSEQQRLFLAVTLCMGIYIGWQALFPPPPAALEAPAAASAPAPAAVAPAASSVPGRPPSPPVQAARALTTPFLESEVVDGDVGLRRLDVRAFTERIDEGGQAVPVSLADAGAVGRPPVPQAQLRWRTGAGPSPAMRFVGPHEAGEAPALAGMSAQGLALHVTVEPRDDAAAIDYVLSAVNPTAEARTVGFDILLQLGKDAGAGEAATGLLSYILPAGAEALSGVCHEGARLQRRELAALGDAGTPWPCAQGLSWLAIDRQYFVLALVPQEGAAGGTAEVYADQGAVVATWHSAEARLAPDGRWEARVTVYAGPKRDADLQTVAPSLREVVDYDLMHVPLGFLARPMMALLNLFARLTGSWGVAIILLTLVVKLVLVPVNWRHTLSMRKMQELKPEIDRLREQFKDDPERFGVEQFKLYRERGVNPLGGCLPMLLQIPVGIALYRALWSAVDLYRQPFLWLPDLTVKEPLPVMAIILGAITVVQQRLTPMASDNPQAKALMVVMPVMLTLLMVALPSGLVLYILVNTVLTILQQLAINRRASTA